MQNKEIIELILRIKKDNKAKTLKTFIKKYIRNNISVLLDNRNTLLLIFVEICKKTDVKIKEALKRIIDIFSKDEIFEKILEALSSLFDDNIWNYITFVYGQKLSLEFIDKFSDKIRIDHISTRTDLTEEFIDKYADKLNWYWVSRFSKLSENLIEKHADKVNWDHISIYQELSEKFIEKYADKVNWSMISEHQKLSEKFIEKYKDKVNWFYISKHQKLSEKFIEKFYYKVYWRIIFKYQNLSKEFKEKNKWRLKYYL